jgi:hypothetical protein
MTLFATWRSRDGRIHADRDSRPSLTACEVRQRPGSTGQGATRCDIIVASAGTGYYYKPCGGIVSLISDVTWTHIPYKGARQH